MSIEQSACNWVSPNVREKEKMFTLQAIQIQLFSNKKLRRGLRSSRGYRGIIWHAPASAEGNVSGGTMAAERIRTDAGGAIGAGWSLRPDGGRAENEQGAQAKRIETGTIKRTILINCSGWVGGDRTQSCRRLTGGRTEGRNVATRPHSIAAIVRTR